MFVLIQCGTPAILISECSCKADEVGGSQGSAGAKSEAAESSLPHIPAQSWVSQVLQPCSWARVPSWQSDGPVSLLATNAIR